MDQNRKSTSAIDCLNKKKQAKKHGDKKNSENKEDCTPDINLYCKKRDAARRGEKTDDSDDYIIPIPKPQECKNKENPCINDKREKVICKAEVIEDYKCGPSKEEKK